MNRINRAMMTIGTNGSAIPLPAPSASDQPAPARPTLVELVITHPLLTTAIAGARQWQQRRREQADAGLPARSSLVLVAAAGDTPNQTGCGCGKTHIARACLWSIAHVIDGEPIAPVGRFFTADQLIQRLDASTPASAEIARAPIVVIDDVGAEQQIPYVPAVRQDDERQARYYKILEHCYTEGIAVVITGNMRLAELPAHIGGRAWSRLLEMAPQGQMIDMTGVPDYRRAKGGR